jgi:DNA ligase-associated metallophosphoesterase
VNAAVRALLSPARRACGSLRVHVAGEPVVLRCSGALWLDGRSTLIAADLHLEKGSAFAARGQMLPPYDSAATLARLAEEIAALNPAAVVLLGDSFHDTRSVDRLADRDGETLHTLAAGRDWIWLEGNHDRATLAEAGARLPGRVVGEMALGPLRLVHEPEPGDQLGEIAGHLHPAATVAAYARAVRRPCFVTDGRRLLMPAFGAFTGGLNVLDPAVAGLFAEPPLVAALGRDRVHPLAWDRML